MKSAAKGIFARGLCSSTATTAAAGHSDMRNNIAVNAEMAAKLWQRMDSDSPELPTNVASLECNEVRNRWSNVLPFDVSRVKLVSNHPPGSGSGCNTINGRGIQKFG